MITVDNNLSPFLHPGSVASESSLAVLHLRRDHLLPTFLSNDEAQNEDYAEGPVTNTRFGSYPHSTLIGCRWGSQVLASQVDTGSRGRKGTGASNKRQQPADETQDASPRKKSKLEDSTGGKDDNAGDQPIEEGGAPISNKQNEHDDLQLGENESSRGDVSNQKEPSSSKKPKKASTAASGYCHILPPTPENWTISLPHRTQVVYTPDYSYILQKLRVRPGSIVLEAGAGSGSFTHAAARAVFSGYPSTAISNLAPTKRFQKYGRVYSYEYHEPRAQQLRLEISSHGLDSFVSVTHRDVYKAGFLLNTNNDTTSHSEPALSPNATHVFLDLPAPWEALPHLTRRSPTPLDPLRQAHLCIFLPCIEQVQRAVAGLRAHGWVEISMQELSQRRIDVRRERVSLELQGLRNVNASPATVDEACARLLEVERNGRRFLNRAAAEAGSADAADEAALGKGETKAERLARIARQAEENKSAFRLGRLVTRAEPEIRTHTSYLVFAVLPRSWTPEDEQAAMKRWPVESARVKGQGGGDAIAAAN